MLLKGVRKDISIVSCTQQLPTQDYVLFGEGGWEEEGEREEELAP